MENKKNGGTLWKNLRSSIQKRGIRIKLTVIIAFIVLGTVGGLASVVIPVQQSSITRKAFSVCEVTALSISAMAAEALLSGQSILLNDIVRGVMNQNVDGLTEVSIIFKSKFFVSSDPKKEQQDVPEELMTRLRSVTTPVVDRKEIAYEQSTGGAIEAFEFVRPIFYQEKRVGYTRIVYSKAAIEAEVNRLKTLSAVTALVVILIALGIVYYVAITISKPIVQVAEAAAKVGSGNLDVRLKIDSLDEIGGLADQFNNMVIELKEKLAMSKFVSSSTVNMIKASGDHQMHLGGERKELAFFFSDVRGFTAMSEKKSPEEVVSVLNEYLDLQTQVIRSFGGDIDKFVGDEIMAVFSGDDKEDHAVQAAIAVIDAVKKNNADRQARNQEPLMIGIGLNSGDVVVGNMGSRDRMDFTAIGDAVNLAARLCSAAEPLQVLASENMLRGAKQKYAGKKLEPIRVKGKEKPIHVFDIRGQSKNQSGGSEPISGV